MGLQLVCWLSLAASFWLTLLPFTVDRLLPPFFVVGAYCLSWVVGFLVPFAPAGLGVRELVLTLAFAPFLDSQTVVLLAGINRLLYFLLEVLLAMASFLLLRLRKSPVLLS